MKLPLTAEACIIASALAFLNAFLVRFIPLPKNPTPRYGLSLLSMEQRQQRINRARKLLIIGGFALLIVAFILTRLG